MEKETDLKSELVKVLLRGGSSVTTSAHDALETTNRNYSAEMSSELFKLSKNIFSPRQCLTTSAYF